MRKCDTFSSAVRRGSQHVFITNELRKPAVALRDISL